MINKSFISKQPDEKNNTANTLPGIKDAAAMTSAGFYPRELAPRPTEHHFFALTPPDNKYNINPDNVV